MKRLATQIYEAVADGRLVEPFDAAAVKKACPGWANGTYSTFLAKHARGNGKDTKLFERVSRGRYCCLGSR